MPHNNSILCIPNAGSITQICSYLEGLLARGSPQVIKVLVLFTTVPQSKAIPDRICSTLRWNEALIAIFRAVCILFDACKKSRTSTRSCSNCNPSAKSPYPRGAVPRFMSMKEPTGSILLVSRTRSFDHSCHRVKRLQRPRVKVIHFLILAMAVKGLVLYRFSASLPLCH